MKKIENRIKASFAEETPDLRDRIMESIEHEEVAGRVGFSSQVIRKRAFSLRYCAVAAALVVTFLTGLISGSFIFGRTTDGGGDTDGSSQQGTSNDGVVPTELASLYIDVNPSVEIKVDLQGTVAEAKAANEDAEQIIGDMNLQGVEIKTALNAIIGSMYMKGYLTDSSNSMLISMKGDETKFESLLKTVVDETNDIFAEANISCSIIAQDCSKNDKTADLADKNSISVGKMTLIEKIIAVDDDYTDDDAEELAKLAIKDLNRLYASLFEKEDEDGDEGKGHGKDMIFGVLEEQSEDAIELAAEYLSQKLSLDIDEDDLTVLAVIPRNEKLDKFRYKLTYIVSVMYDLELYTLTVDCDGETVSETESDIGGGLFDDFPNVSDPFSPDDEHGDGSHSDRDGDEHGSHKPEKP